MSRASRFSIKTVMKSSTPKRTSFARMKKYSQDSIDHSMPHHLSLARRYSAEQDSLSSYNSEQVKQRRNQNRSPKPRPRKIAQVERFSDFEVVDDGSSVEQVASPKQRQRPEVGSTPTLYTIFQRILQVCVLCVCV